MYSAGPSAKMIPDSTLRLRLPYHRAGELQLKPPNVLHEGVDNITAFQVNPEPSVPKRGGWGLLHVLLGVREANYFCSLHASLVLC